MQRLVIGAFIAGTLAGGAAITAGAGTSDRVLLALLPVGAGLVAGVLALLRA